GTASTGRDRSLQPADDVLRLFAREGAQRLGVFGAEPLQAQDDLGGGLVVRGLEDLDHVVLAERDVVADERAAGLLPGALTLLVRLPVIGVGVHPTSVLPLGRRLADTTGPLLLPNVRPLAPRLAQPRYGVEKVYEADGEGEPSDAALRSLADGVELEDGRTAP